MARPLSREYQEMSIVGAGVAAGPPHAAATTPCKAGRRCHRRLSDGLRDTPCRPDHPMHSPPAPTLEAPALARSALLWASGGGGALTPHSQPAGEPKVPL